jgi:hypothetical protein
MPDDWPVTHRNHFGIGLPLTPESYFVLQGREREYAPFLEQWCREHGLVQQAWRVHGLVCAVRLGALQYTVSLMCEGVPNATPLHVGQMIYCDFAPALNAPELGEALQTFIATLPRLYAESLLYVS